MKLGSSMFAPCMLLAMLFASVSSSAAAPLGHERLNDVLEPTVTRWGSRVFGGTPIRTALHPWMAFITFSVSTDYARECGGSYIGSSSSTSHYFLTVAHCLPHNRTTIQNTYVTLLKDKINATSDANVIEFIEPYSSDDLLQVHPSYASDMYHLDIAIVKTTAKIDLSLLPSPVSLAVAESPLYAGTSVQAIGYGGPYENNTWNPVLRSAYMNVVDSESCVHQYETFEKNTTVEDYQNITSEIDLDQTICATAPGREVCFGDDGGPLFLTQDSQDVQLGIVAFGVRCTDNPGGPPGVYVKVALFSNWIDSVVGSGLVSYVKGSGSDGEYVMGTSSSPASVHALNFAFVLPVAAAIFLL